MLLKLRLNITSWIVTRLSCTRPSSRFSNHIRSYSPLQSSPISVDVIPESSINFLTSQDLKTLIFAQYCHGKFFNILRHVVASPSVLLTACQNLKTHSSNASNSSNAFLIDSISCRFSLEKMAHDLADDRFDIESCCIKISPKTDKAPLILPNLELKVVIEAIRMVLELIYNDKFVTFAYGGRVNMGRHTAIRYLKNSVQNPSWWFTVSFKPEFFVDKHVNKLCSVLEEKIGDSSLIKLLKRLFECQALRIQIGGFYLGKGFPQECSLSSILINVYFNAFDKELQKLRLQTSQKNPKLDSVDVSGPNVFYKPLKIHVVRYLDELLVIISGSKRLTMDLKTWVFNFLEENLGFQVDRLKSLIRSTVADNISFLGMELQAVKPSVLRQCKSEKAIRAHKKYLRQKEVKALELRNARETRRKKLGMKVMHIAHKKLKKIGDFESDSQIEDEVREIFKTWADEVVHDFLNSLDDKWNWHQMLTTGDFLSLKHIRDQLPRDLVDSYDEFCNQVDMYLSPVKAREALGEAYRKTVEEEERNYSEKTIKDLTSLCMKVSAPINLIRELVRMAGFTNHMGRPRPINFLFVLEDSDIIKWYAGVGRRWLNYYCCCHNFKMVKTVVSYHLRFSCLLTLSQKHESNKKEAIRHYTKDLKVTDLDGVEEICFPTEQEVERMRDKNFADPKPVDGALSLILTRLASDDPPYACAAHFCCRTDTTVYRIRLLQNTINMCASDGKNWGLTMGEIDESMNLKCFPLCPDHASDLYLAKITFQDIDCSSLLNVD